MEIVNQPHDKFFKEVFSNLEIAIDFPTNYLPPEILAITDLETVTIEKDSYTSVELKEYYSDLLCQAKINNEDSYIYFLIEHKSYLSQQTPYQLLKYMLRIWEAKTEKNKPENDTNEIEKGNKLKKLPLIIPIVIYHGASEWKLDKNFSKMIKGIEKLPPEVIKHIPNFEYLLYDLTTYELEELKGNLILRETLKILAAMFRDIDEFMTVVAQTMRSLKEAGWSSTNDYYYNTFIFYIMNARSELTIEAVNNLAKKIIPERSEKLMTIAERLREEGRQEARQEAMTIAERLREEGRQEARQEAMTIAERLREEGIEKGRRETAKNILSEGFSPEQTVKFTKLPLEEVLKLKKEIED